MKQITVVVKEPGKPAESRDIDATLASYQKMVGGYITSVGFLWPNTFILMDEEADFKTNAVDNIKAPETIMTKNGTFKGPVFVCGQTRNDFSSLPAKYVQKAIDYLNENAV